MKGEQLKRKNEIRLLLEDAETRMATWDDSESNNSARYVISLVIGILRRHIADDLSGRRLQSTGAYRIITDSTEVAETDAGRLVLDAIALYDQFE